MGVSHNDGSVVRSLYPKRHKNNKNQGLEEDWLKKALQSVWL